MDVDHHDTEQINPQTKAFVTSIKGYSEKIDWQKNQPVDYAEIVLESIYPI